jgi:hypothetical protein
MANDTVVVEGALTTNLQEVGALISHFGDLEVS